MIPDIDLNVLRVFDALMRHGSVTRAGRALGLSQPAMSAALAKLRTALGDPLFVRTGRGMQPTPHAVDLAEPIRRVLDTVQAEVLHKRTFEAATTRRVFTIVTPDIGEVVFVPRILAHAERHAPGIGLRTVAIPSPAAGEALASGEADLAIGYFPDLARPGFRQQRLFRNSFVCIVRADHPDIGGRLTMPQFLAAAHAFVRPAGRVHLFERFLEERGIKVSVRVQLAHFSSLLTVVGQSDLVATVPRDIGHVFATLAPVRLLEPPLQPKPFDVRQHWHERVHADPAHRWLRATVRELFHD